MSTPTNHTTSSPHYLSQGDRVNPTLPGQAPVCSGTFCGKTTRQSKATCSLCPGEATPSGAPADHLLRVDIKGLSLVSKGCGDLNQQEAANLELNARRKRRHTSGEPTDYDSGAPLKRMRHRDTYLMSTLSDHLQHAVPSLSSRASSPEKTDSFQFPLLPAELQYMILRKLPPLDAIKLYPALAAFDENEVCIDSLLKNINPKTYSGIEKLAEKQRRELENNARLALCTASPSPVRQNLYPYIQSQVSGTGQSVLYSLLVKHKQLVNPTRIDGLDRVSLRKIPRCSALLSTSQLALSTWDGSVNIYSTQPPEGPLQPLKVLQQFLPGEVYRTSGLCVEIGYDPRQVQTIKEISADCLVTASDYRIKLWDMTTNTPTDFKIIEFDSYIIHLDFTDKFLSVLLFDGTMQQISLSSGDEGKVLAEYRFYSYPSFLTGDHWHQANPRAEKLIDLVTRNIKDISDRKAAITWINDQKENFHIESVKLTDSQIFLQKAIDSRDINTKIAVSEIHYLNNDADNKIDNAYVTMPSTIRSLFLKTGDWVWFQCGKEVTIVNNRQPANPTRSLAFSNDITQVIELANGFLACTTHEAIYIVNPNQPDIIVDTLWPSTKNLNSNPSKFCYSYLISNTLMLTTTTSGYNNAVIWDLSDIVESHHPEASVQNPGGPAADQERSGQQRQPIATIELPDHNITELRYIHDGQAIMVYRNPDVAGEYKICIWDFFADPLFMAKKSNSNSSP